MDGLMPDMSKLREQDPASDDSVFENFTMSASDPMFADIPEFSDVPEFVDIPEFTDIVEFSDLAEFADIAERAATVEFAGIPEFPPPQSRAAASSMGPPTSSNNGRRHASHSRPISHPFPSRSFGPKTYQEASGRAWPDPSYGLASSFPAPLNHHAPAPKWIVDGRGDGRPGRDLRAANCMTCASLMRWPREADGFRCAVCFTINDLVRHQPPGSAGGRARPISVEETKRRAKKCIHAFLTQHVIRPSQDPKNPPSPGIGPFDDPGHKIASKAIFRWLNDYILHCFSSFDCVNSSFAVPRHQPQQRDPALRRKPVPGPGGPDPRRCPDPRSEPDPRRCPDPQREQLDLRRCHFPSRFLAPMRDVVLSDAAVCLSTPTPFRPGNVAEIGLWTGGQFETPPGPRRSVSRGENGSNQPVVRPHHIEWSELADWYSVILNCAQLWTEVYEDVSRDENFIAPSPEVLEELELQLLRAQHHTQAVLLKATEMLLKRPGRFLTNPDDIRFLLIVLANPLLLRNMEQFQGRMQSEPLTPERHAGWEDEAFATRPAGGEYSRIIKRILGLASNSSTPCQDAFVASFAKYPLPRFVQVKELAADFLTYRLVCQSYRKPEPERIDVTAGLVPRIEAGRSVACLHAELRNLNFPKRTNEEPKRAVDHDDWQMKAAAQFLSLLFSANNWEAIRHGDGQMVPLSNQAALTEGGIHTHGQMLPTSDFYNSLLDLTDLVGEFQAWQSRRDKFSFCNYPFLLSIWAKTQILEFDARRQMATRAGDAYFNSLRNRTSLQQFLNLTVRRDCLVEDSLKGVSEVINCGCEDVKKRLRISFKGEEGVDAGGLRKEWFLLLVREVFNPDHGMFVYDEESNYSYFNPNTFEVSEQFFLIGVVLGLAIYNSTILDVALPPFLFRKLLASVPAATSAAAAHFTLGDLQEFQPRRAKSLRQLLEYDGDVEDFGLDFTIGVDQYGHPTTVPLCPNGDHRAVTNANRREYVDLYVRYVLDTSVARQFEPFARGFWKVCGGKTLTLFRPEETELLVRGSAGALDVPSLKAVARYDNWGSRDPEETEPVIGWFWQSFADASARDQRKLLSFITGSDRIPATGAAGFTITISCLGDHTDRFPIARTCFNMLALFRYESREQLESRLWRAVNESAGFGLQ